MEIRKSDAPDHGSACLLAGSTLRARASSSLAGRLTAGEARRQLMQLTTATTTTNRRIPNDGRTNRQREARRQLTADDPKKPPPPPAGKGQIESRSGRPQRAGYVRIWPPPPDGWIMQQI